MHVEQLSAMALALAHCLVLEEGSILEIAGMLGLHIKGHLFVMRLCINYLRE